MIRFLPSLLAALILLSGCSGPKSSESGSSQPSGRKIRIEVASFIPLSVNVLGEQLTHITEELKAISGGNVELEIFEPGALVGALEILDAVSGRESGRWIRRFWLLGRKTFRRSSFLLDTIWTRRLRSFCPGFTRATA